MKKPGLGRVFWVGRPAGEAPNKPGQAGAVSARDLSLFLGG